MTVLDWIGVVLALIATPFFVWFVFNKNKKQAH